MVAALSPQLVCIAPRNARASSVGLVAMNSAATVGSATTSASHAHFASPIHFRSKARMSVAFSSLGVCSPRNGAGVSGPNSRSFCRRCSHVSEEEENDGHASTIPLKVICASLSPAESSSCWGSSRASSEVIRGGGAGSVAASVREVQGPSLPEMEWSPPPPVEG